MTFSRVRPSDAPSNGCSKTRFERALISHNTLPREFGFDGTTSKGAIRVLDREGVIDEETADTLIAAVGFRNVLAHEYGRVDYDEVYRSLQTGLSVYDTYSQQVAQWMRTD